MEASEVIYLDANVFIYAAVDPNGIGDAARAIIMAVKERRLPAITSSVSFDETVWIVRKLKGQQAAIDAGEALLSIEGLVVADLNRTVLSEALQTIKNFKLKPQDAVHFATAKIKGTDGIVSEDSDFDAADIKRYRIEEFARKKHL